MFAAKLSRSSTKTIAPGPQVIQRNLNIGVVNDPLEQEADHIANQVMRMQTADKPQSSGRPMLNRKCAACEEEEERQLQRLASAHSASALQRAEAPAIVHDVLGSPGQPLDTSERSFFEPRLGFDLSRVRIHTDEQASESARSVGALAYTTGTHIAFRSGQYQPKSPKGMHLLAHELTHVVQQSGNGTDLQRFRSPAQQKVPRAELQSGTTPVNDRAHITMTASRLQRHKDDLVAYGGGQSSSLDVIQAGKLIYLAPAVSGHPGHGENEVSVGPIPAGRYIIHPGITAPPVTTLQSGTCGAAGITAGYQEISSNECSPCSGAHYCHVPCPTKDKPDQKGFTPRDCWGPMRIKIEGSQAVTSPEGKHVTRDGFFIHGGNPADAVSSGCAKTLDNGVFAAIRKLSGVKGAVPFCVGSACPPSVEAAVNQATVEAVSAAVQSISGALGNLSPW